MLRRSWQAYWRLYEVRCHLLQQEDLLRRAERIEVLLDARRDFDAGRIELAKARQRVARRADRELQLTGEVLKQQTRLASLVGTETLLTSGNELEMIPRESPEFPALRMKLRDAVQRGIENRPEIRSATAALESAALSIRVTRSELQPQLNAVIDAYLAGLNGNFGAVNSFSDQFAGNGPGLGAGLQYDMPYGRRAARSRHREAHHLFQQRSEQLRETIQLTQAQIETALVNVNTAIAFANDEASIIANRD